MEPDVSRPWPLVTVAALARALHFNCTTAKGKVQKKNLKKKLTSVSFMYVCVAENGEMLVFFSFFFPTIV